MYWEYMRRIAGVPEMIKEKLLYLFVGYPIMRAQDAGSPRGSMYDASATCCPSPPDDDELFVGKPDVYIMS